MGQFSVFFFAVSALVILAQVATVRSDDKVLIRPALERGQPEKIPDDEYAKLSSGNLVAQPKGTGKIPQPKNAGKRPADKKSTVNSHIVGGLTATRGQFPYQLYIVMDNAYACGASLLSDTWCLTAAHCLYQRSNVTVYLGAQDLAVAEPGRISRTTNTFTIHESYNHTTLINDIAVIKFTTPVTMGTNISAIRLPKTSDSTKTFEGVLTTVSGWGNTSATTTTSKLQYVSNRPVISNTLCATYYGGSIVNTTLCISTRDSANATRSTCSGDSGGPLVYQESDGLWTQIGCVSFGLHPCIDRMAAAFTRVASYTAWISSKTGLAIRA